ncbi:AbrB/MazE/SpoVT family DNA-binding domain-containing protein [Bacillus sp. HSf4]|uniref:AbrB/MazE/SpoVT family DNA-binding domain-containing protein n=1 Tax=Bacillus sp. HSf4 TaxID=3035514 RepID=UPI00240A6BF9|nr:AbrB/MazE/SpoVT family DNA-binding domain-containing protein [Bacillus sp. HSf4]WFA03825.1 AbrB/MazE/SpoVT family DNA-binding domain-containing protein [Bacillus sp. HSf4]
MRSTGILRKIDGQGRVVLPKSMIRSLGINGSDPVEYFVDDEKIIIRKYQKDKTCIVTGEVSDQNITLSGDIVLSPEGARSLLEDLLAYRLKVNFEKKLAVLKK